MEAKNSKRELKCKSGSVRTTVIDPGFGYMEIKEPDDGTYAPDFSEIAAVAEKEKKAQAMERKDHVFLHDLGKEFQLDRSNLRKFVIRHKISTTKLRHPSLRQMCLAITKKDAKRLMELKFGG